MAGRGSRVSCRAPTFSWGGSTGSDVVFQVRRLLSLWGCGSPHPARAPRNTTENTERTLAGWGLSRVRSAASPQPCWESTSVGAGFWACGLRRTWRRRTVAVAINAREGARESLQSGNAKSPRPDSAWLARAAVADRPGVRGRWGESGGAKTQRTYRVECQSIVRHLVRDQQMWLMKSGVERPALFCTMQGPPIRQPTASLTGPGFLRAVTGDYEANRYWQETQIDVPRMVGIASRQSPGGLRFRVNLEPGSHSVLDGTGWFAGSV